MQVINFLELSGKLTSSAFLFPETPGVLRLPYKPRKLNGVAIQKCIFYTYCEQILALDREVTLSLTSVPPFLDHTVNLPHVYCK